MKQVGICYRNFAGDWCHAVEVRPIPFDLRQPALFRSYWHTGEEKTMEQEFNQAVGEARDFFRFKQSHPYTAGSLFSGAGMMDLAASSAGFDIQFQVEIDPFCRKVLAKHAKNYWPNSQQYDDVTRLRGSDLPRVDILFGGFPCQPHSVAGKRLGKEDRRNLWPDFLRLISDLRPRAVLLENVPGLLRPHKRNGGWEPAYAFQVISDLARVGYVGRAGIVPASAAGAPHQRKRWFCVAYADGIGYDQSAVVGQSGDDQKRHIETRRAEWGTIAGEIVAGGEVLADSHNDRSQAGLLRGGVWDAPAGSGQELADSFGAGLEGGTQAGNPRSQGTNLQQHTGRHDPSLPRVRSPQPGLGRAVDGATLRVDGHHGFPARPGEDQKEWEAPRTVHKKAAHHADRLKALGNGVVPQQVYPIFAALVMMLARQDEL